MEGVGVNGKPAVGVCWRTSGVVSVGSEWIALEQQCSDDVGCEFCEWTQTVGRWEVLER